MALVCRRQSKRIETLNVVRLSSQPVLALKVMPCGAAWFPSRAHRSSHTSSGVCAAIPVAQGETRKQVQR